MAKKRDDELKEEAAEVTPATLEAEFDDGGSDEPELGGFNDPIITKQARKPAAKKEEPKDESAADDTPAPEPKKPPFTLVKAPPSADEDDADAYQATPPEPAQATPPDETDIQKQLRDAVNLIQQQGAQIAHLSQAVQQRQQPPEPQAQAEPEPQEPTQEEWDTDALAAMKKHDAVIEHRIWKRYQGHQQEQTQTQQFQTEVQHWDQQAAAHIPGYQEISPKADLLMREAAKNPSAGLRGIDKVPAGKFLVSLVEAVFSGKLVPAGQQQQAPPPQQAPAAEPPTASGVLEQSRLARIKSGQSAPPTPNKKPATPGIDLTREQIEHCRKYGINQQAYAAQIARMMPKRRTA